MANPGWYPDPGGSGQFRYWDGVRWSATTAPTPAGPPPGGPPGGPTGPGSPDSGRPRTSRGPIAAIIGLVSVVVVVLIVVFFLRPWDNGLEITGDPPTPTVSAWNDGSTPTPTPTPSASSARPSPSASQPSAGRSSGEPPPTKACPVGDPLTRVQHPDDGRVHGGRLSFGSIPGWVPDYQSIGLSYAYDVGSNSHMLTSNWFAMSAVGAIQKSDFAGDPHRAAGLLMQCVSSSSFYSSLVRVEPVWDKKVAVSGHDAWSVRVKIFCDVQGHPEIKGDVVDVIVVETGAPDMLGMYFGSATIDDPTTMNAMESSISSLRVD